MWYVIAPGALPIRGHGQFSTFEEATKHVNTSIWQHCVYYAEKKNIIKLDVKWIDCKLYHNDIVLDQTYCFNTRSEAVRFKRRFKLEARKLWRTMRS